MRIMERLIQKVDRTSWSKKIAIEKRYEVVEARLGFPPSRRYRAYIGANDTNTRVIERDWSSLGGLSDHRGESACKIPSGRPWAASRSGSC